MAWNTVSEGEIYKDSKNESSTPYYAIMSSGERKDNLIFLFGTEEIVVNPERFAKCLIVSTELGNYCIGYYSEEPGTDQNRVIAIDGDLLLKAGESKALIASVDGTIGIYSVVVQDDKTIQKFPRLVYNYENEFVMNASKINMGLLNAGGNLSWSEDELRNFIYSFTSKTHALDTGLRFISELKNGLTGPEYKGVIDLTPSPIGGMPRAMLENSPIANAKIEMTPLKPVEINVKGAPGAKVTVSVGVDSSLKISSTLAAIKSSFELYPTGKVVLSNNLGSFEISPTGKISISGMAGIDLKGANVSLIQTIIDFLSSNFNAHTHLTGTGPSSPPVVPAAADILKLTTIKGV